MPVKAFRKHKKVFNFTAPLKPCEVSESVTQHQRWPPCDFELARRNQTMAGKTLHETVNCQGHNANSVHNTVQTRHHDSFWI